MNLSENEKRWVVTGVALNKVLLPELRSFVNQKVQNQYTNLVSSHSIHVQTATTYLKKWTKCPLKYENINCNEKYKLAGGKYDYPRFDFKVANHVDLAKLYLLPFMAKFNAFDEDCDLSAVLVLLGSVPIFPAALQTAATVLRGQVRNEWAHCNFTEWDAAKFKGSFKEMDVLIQNLGLASCDEAKLLSMVHDWKTKGTILCTNSPIDPELLKLVREEICQLKSDVAHYSFESKDEEMQLEQKIKEIEEHFQRQIEELKGQAKETNKRVDSVEGDVKETNKRVDSVEGDVQEIKDKINNFGVSKDKTSASGKDNYFFGVPDRNAYFTGREIELITLNQKPLGNKTPQGAAELENIQHQMLAISGLGGIGKTATAIEFAWRARGYYPGGIFWLSGESDEMLSKSIRQLTELLGDDMDYQVEKKEGVESNQKKKKDEEKKGVNILTQKLSRVLMWLHKRSLPWLMVVDNTDHLELTPYMYELLCGTWKRESLGDILVTSRCKSEELQEVLKLQPTNIITLCPLTVIEATEFLIKRLDISCYEGVSDLADELGGLPLALEQAAVYIKVVKCSVKEYLEEYHEQRQKLLSKKKICPISEYYTKERLAIHTTWQVNIEHISKGGDDLRLGEAALLMIKISAFLFSDVIPIELINVGRPKVDNQKFCRFAKKSFGQRQIIDLMTKFSLFQESPDSNSLSVHRLVQEIIRERCEEDLTRDFVLSCAVKVLHKAFCDTFTAADLVCWWKTFDKWDTKDTDTKPKQLPSPSTGGLWLKLAMNSNCLIAHLVNVVNGDNAKLLWFTQETARIMCETALYFRHFRKFTESRSCCKAMLSILCGLEKCPSDNDFDKLTCSICLNNAPLTDDFTCSFGSWSTALTPIEKVKDFISFTEREARNAFAHGNYEQCCMLIDLISPPPDFGEISNAATGVYSANVYPKHANLYNYRSASLFKLQKYEEALSDVHKWLKCCPDLIIAHKRKVVILCKLEKENMLRWRARARAAMAVFIHMFGKDKAQKLENRFPQILKKILFVAVSNTREWLAMDKNKDGEIIYIFTGESYQIDKLVCTKSSVSFVGLPGKLIQLYFNSVLILSSVDKQELQAECIYMMENLHLIIKPGCFVCTECVFLVANCLFELAMGKTSSDEQECINTSIKSYLRERELKCVRPSLLSGYGMKEVFISNSKFTGLSSNPISQFFHRCCGLWFIRSSVVLKANIVNQFFNGIKLFDCTNSAGNLVFGNCVFNCNNGIFGTDMNNVSFAENNLFFNYQGIILLSCKATRVVENRISLNFHHGIIVSSSNVIFEENDISSNYCWGVVITTNSNLDMKLNNISNNVFGGVRILLNNSGVLTLQNNVMYNRGPSVFPIESPAFLEQQFMEFGSSNGGDDDTFEMYSDDFLFPLEIEDNHTKFSFNPPKLIDNVQNQNDPVELKKKTWLPELCCFCYYRLNENPFKCETCLLSSYCGEQCYLKHKKHRKICQALLSVYTVELRPLSVFSGKSHCGKTIVLRQRLDGVDLDFVGMSRFQWQESSGDLKFSCFLTTFQRELLLAFQHMFGFLEPSLMLEVKDSFVYARIEDNGKICRIFLLEPAPAFPSIS